MKWVKRPVSSGAEWVSGDIEVRLLSWVLGRKKSSVSLSWTLSSEQIPSPMNYHRTDGPAVSCFEMITDDIEALRSLDDPRLIDNFDLKFNRLWYLYGVPLPWRRNHALTTFPVIDKRWILRQLRSGEEDVSKLQLVAEHFGIRGLDKLWASAELLGDL